MVLSIVLQSSKLEKEEEVFGRRKFFILKCKRTSSIYMYVLVLSLLASCLGQGR